MFLSSLMLVENMKEAKKFIDKYLRCDGVFVLRMLTMHAGIIFGVDLTASLWETFYSIEYDQQDRLIYFYAKK